MSEQVLAPHEASAVPAAGLKPERAPAPSAWLDRPIAAMATWPWETLLWVALVAVAAFLRLYELGARGMSHDESLHTLYGYYLYNEGRYEHNPMMHGPFRFHMTALTYFLLGANDYTSRLLPAIFGISLVAVMYAFRRWLGRTGALIAAVLITFSPSLLFHSRYIRDDIYIATWTTLWALCAFRYVETRRYRWLFGMAVVMGFSFATMENSFITGAVIGGFFLLYALWQAIESRLFVVIAPAIPLALIGYYYHTVDSNGMAALFVGMGLAATLILAIYFMVTSSGSWSRLRHSLAADLAVLMVTLVMPFLAAFLYVAVGGSATVFKESEYLTEPIMRQMAGLVAVAALLATALATAWFRFARRGDDEGRVGLYEWGQMMAVFWVIEILFFTTFFTNTRDGLATGIVGSLGYWLAQQEVARGGQPWYYYMMLGGLYEFVPIVLTFAGGITLARGLLFKRDWQVVGASDLPPQPDAWSPASAVETRTAFVVFALTWVVGMWSAYMVAGEKMPWLLTHMALPMCVFGGWWLARLLHGVDWVRARASRAIWLIALVPALIVIAAIFLRSIPSGDRTIEAVGGWMRFLLSGVTLASLVYLAVRWIVTAGWRLGGTLLGVGALLLLFVFNVRASLMLNFVNYDMATEYLVYAHASPDVKRALAEIESISQRTAGDRNLIVAYDDESSWPMSWYMRDYPNVRFYGDKPDSNSMSAPVVLVGPKNRDKVAPYVERDYAKRTYRLIWWPDMDYFNMTWERLWYAITNPQQRERLMQIILFRRHRDTADFSRFRDLTKWPAQHEFDMWVRKDLASQIWDLNVTPQGLTAEQNPLLAVPDLEMAATALYTGPYGGAPLLQPRAVAVAPSGNRVIADSGNHRIVVTDPAGLELAVFGSRCDLATGAEGGCLDPDGSGPLQLGDGQFNEPWGLAVDQEGNIYVADTWNGRIQVFDASGAFLRKWGYFNTTNGELGDGMALFGPRGIAFDLAGNLLVADTGNKRIVRYTPQGQLVDQAGGGGVIPGRFDEPTGVAVDPSDGSIVVADAWNRRIQRLDANLGFLAEYPVPGWESKEIYHKPGITVNANGDIYVSDPQFYRIFVFDGSGTLRGVFGRYGVEGNQFGMPNGLASDLGGGSLLVADADNNRAMAFPMVP